MEKLIALYIIIIIMCILQHYYFLSSNSLLCLKEIRLLLYPYLHVVLLKNVFSIAFP